MKSFDRNEIIKKSFLADSKIPRAEKTIRYKGHAQGIKILKEFGLFSRQPIKLHDTKVIPRELLEVKSIIKKY